MSKYVHLSEAAEYLGVSKGTLRNWDRSGKLIARRNPTNGYRQYATEDLIALKKTLLDFEEPPSIDSSETHSDSVDSKKIKATISKLNNILRDSDASSDIMERFDEVSKLIFLYLVGEPFETPIPTTTEEVGAFADLVRDRYAETIRACGVDTHNAFNSLNLPNAAIVKCMDVLVKMDLSDMRSDLKGLAYEEIIKGTFDKNDNQQYFTPDTIVKFMVEMLLPQIGGTVCDPACGTGGFLIEASRARADARYLGLEIDPRLAWVSDMNMRLHGVDESSIKCLANAGSLGEGAERYFCTVDVILTNPPFGSDYSDQETLSRFELGRNKKSRRRGILFLEQSFKLLREDGIVGIIIDQGVLNSTSALDVREYLLSHFNILAIVDLPESAFMPYASVSTSVLFLQKREENSRDNTARNVFYARALNVGRKANGDPDYNYKGDGSSELNSDLPSIVHKWRQFEKSGYIEPSENCYCCCFDHEPFDNPGCRIDFAFHHPIRLESIREIEACPFPLIPLSELCAERNETYLPASNPDVSTILMTGLASIDSFTGNYIQVPTAAASVKSAVKKYEPNDIIFAKMRPLLRKVAHISSEASGYASSECAVFVVRRGPDGDFIMKPELIAAILRSDFVFGQIMHLVSGSGRPRISSKDLRRVLIPVIPIDQQHSLIGSISANAEAASKLRSNAAALIAEANKLERESVSELLSNLMKKDLQNG